MAKNDKADDLASDISKLILNNVVPDTEMMTALKKEQRLRDYYYQIGANQELKLKPVQPKHHSGIAVRYLGSGMHTLRVVQWLASLTTKAFIVHPCSKGLEVFTRGSMRDDGTMVLYAGDIATIYIRKGQWIVIDEANVIRIYDEYDFRYLYEEIKE